MRLRADIGIHLAAFTVDQRPIEGDEPDLELGATDVDGAHHRSELLHGDPVSPRYVGRPPRG